MAGFPCYLEIYSDNGTFIVSVTEYDLNTGQYPTVAQVLATNSCINNGITGISITAGGTALSDNTIIDYDTGFENDGGNLKGYAVEPVPEPETITGFYLDGTEYKLPVPDDTAFGSSWDGDTTHAPSKNAVYDAIGNIETLLAAL